MIMTATPKPLPRRRMMLAHNWLALASDPALFDRSVIDLIENMIDYTINTRKHGVETIISDTSRN
jgi:hypothetical protein